MQLDMTVHGFRAIHDARFRLEEGLNVLVGPNGSGKSCVMGSLMFLKDILRYGASEAVARSGGRNRVYTHGSESTELVLVADYGSRTVRRRKRSCTMEWEIHIAPSADMGPDIVVFERLGLFGNYRGKRIRLVEFALDKRDRGARHIDVEWGPLEYTGRDLLDSYTGTPREEVRKSVNKRVTNTERRLQSFPGRSFFPLIASMDSALLRLLSQFVFLQQYRISPDQSRQSVHSGGSLETNGLGVPSVIEALEKRMYDELRLSATSELRRLIPRDPDFEVEDEPWQWMRIDWRLPYELERLYPKSHEIGSYPFRRRKTEGRPDPLHDCLEIINAELGAAVPPLRHVGTSMEHETGRRKLVFFTEGQDIFDAWDVSDGTIKWLCLLVAIYAIAPRVFLLEEPENYLHPWMQQRLVVVMREESRKYGLTFLVSTHSPTMLNTVVPSEVLVTSMGEGGASVTRIREREELEELLEKSRFRLGDYWVAGEIGGVPNA